MDANKYRWCTRFEGEYIIHDMVNDMSVRTDRDFSHSAVFKHGRLVSTFDISDMTLKDYEAYLLRMDESARQLDLFYNED